MMIAFSSKNTRKIFNPGIFLCLGLIAVSSYSTETEILLTPPGLRLISDPSVVIQAGFHYPNRPITLPAYRDFSGNPASGWAVKFVHTRRFASNQSAWIFFRISDLQQSVLKSRQGGRESFRFWPVGTTIIIEIYKGNALQKEKDGLIEIAAMSKINADGGSFSRAFHPVSWTYARFDPDRTPSIGSAKVRECHQCHSIAFHLTGDLIFTRFP